jgi:hypothetical protein
MERIRIDFAEKVRARLIKSGYFGDVSILAEDSDQVPDFTMIGTFTQATIGTNGFSLYNILTQQAYDTASSVKIVGGILRGKDSEPVTTFQCAVECCQPLAGSPLPRAPETGMQKVEHSVDGIAVYLEKTYSRMGNPRDRNGRH